MNTLSTIHTAHTARAARSSRPRQGLAARAAAAALLLTTTFSSIGVAPAFADFQDAGSGSDVMIGKDNDNTNNPVIHPAGTAANQSLNNTDVLLAGSGNDVLIGLLGSDVMLAGSGSDILVGGTEQGSQPNSDVMFGDSGNDVSIWAGGDGSEVFIGGTGLDAEVFGVIDRENNVPTLTGTAPGFPSGIPTANTSGSPGFCTLEKVTDPTLGYEYLVRFFLRSTGALAVTVRLNETEQVFCTNQAGGGIEYADLTSEWPQFAPVSLDQVKQLNPLVGQIIR
jgi:Ca2+-binding RTX toxin-like protein